MKNTVLILFTVIIIALPGCKQKKTGFSEDSFLGEWYTIKGDVEAYSFLKDSNSYIFTGTQGMRPVVYGTWKIDKNKFIITMDNGTTTAYNFAVSNDTLIFNEGAEIYTRTEPLDVKYPEVRVLVNISSDFTNLKFSAPRPDELKWGSWIDSTRSSQSFNLKGFSISAGTTLSSGVISEISNYLKDYGFEPDTIYVTEICNGFRDNDQIVTICTSQDPEANNDSIYIHITSGFIVK
ncbi:MAG: hypothetical protein EPN88_01185 [Bacteroidetes bacterium]|nr:MAG: hypothetical protein EPN88_01185 [Bacteroidota bacterium]